MENKTIDQATAFVREHMAKNHGEVPTWGRYQQLVKSHLQDGFHLKFKMPQEYHYAYLRGKGLGDAEARERMGLIGVGARAQAPRKEAWAWLKFWQ